MFTSWKKGYMSLWLVANKCGVGGKGILYYLKPLYAIVEKLVE
jgi:hypothetical protein